MSTYTTLPPIVAPTPRQTLWQRLPGLLGEGVKCCESSLQSLRRGGSITVKGTNMKLRFEIVLAVLITLLGWQAPAQTTATNKPETARKTPGAPPRVWTFKQGNKLEAWLVNFQGGEQVLLKRASDFKTYAVNISFLSADDQTYLGKIREMTRKTQLSAEAKNLEQQGKAELTVDLMRNHPKNLNEFKDCWMDAEFDKIDGGNLLSLTRSQESQDKWLSSIAGEHFKTTDWRDDCLGFSVVDKNGESYGYCWVPKKRPAGLAVAKLKQGDKVRLIGNVSDMEVFGADKYQLWFYIQSVRLIAPAIRNAAP